MKQLTIKLYSAIDDTFIEECPVVNLKWDRYENLTEIRYTSDGDAETLYINDASKEYIDLTGTVRGVLQV